MQVSHDTEQWQKQALRAKWCNFPRPLWKTSVNGCLLTGRLAVQILLHPRPSLCSWIRLLILNCCRVLTAHCIATTTKLLCEWVNRKPLENTWGHSYATRTGLQKRSTCTVLHPQTTSRTVAVEEITDSENKLVAAL